MENLREIQENEIIALKAIYCNDFEDLRSDKKSNQIVGAKEKKSFLPGDNNVPLVRVTLFPQNSQSQHERNLYVQIDLRVKFTPNYPNELPKINLENEKGKLIFQKEIGPKDAFYFTRVLDSLGKTESGFSGRVTFT